eukprot:CAMPEP_0177438640 /NCGR_PEP_ID=MMETSP0369-20130122/2869_1 /TAXON_ID=447022 ORGANISM="Scrippsiella hangoei-like, Strain SHHI-4" /NCGR_SAMPLE_ID=MMETSP0369 /ASSEMBLY_ACC=CAM_ASM_000364 /LENGTH=201 /DNA_ID=CAMNT_0018910233 /DNA_START=317 /DNA_END=922 /DNA_ORIENTATION=+
MATLNGGGSFIAQGGDVVIGAILAGLVPPASATAATAAATLAAASGARAGATSGTAPSSAGPSSEAGTAAAPPMPGESAGCSSSLSAAWTYIRIKSSSKGVTCLDISASAAIAAKARAARAAVRRNVSLAVVVEADLGIRLLLRAMLRLCDGERCTDRRVVLGREGEDVKVGGQTGHFVLLSDWPIGQEVVLVLLAATTPE